jgi:4-amino-4-deoxy-L-arabinose transferase-like glycosyltransferase
VRERPPRYFVAACLFAAAIYGAYLYRHTCFAVGGSDSSGYANAARAIARGRLVEPIAALARYGLPDSDAPAFVPLGYLRGPRPGTMSLLYPPGFPLHLALAGTIFGWSAAPYLVSPIAALLSLAAVYAVGRRLGFSAPQAAGASAILAACPVFIFQAIQPMSDVVATLWCAAAVLCALRSREDVRWSLAAGFCFGVAVLIRPLDVLLAVPLACAMPLDRRRVGAFLAGGVPAGLGMAVYDSLSYGSPLSTGYGLTGHWEALAWSNFPPRAWNYLRWTAQVLTPVVGLGWIWAVLDRRLASWTRALLFTWIAVFFLFYCFYAPADAWWYTRFLLPGVPALPIGFLIALRRLGARVAAWRPTWRAPSGIVGALAVLAVVALGFRATRRLGVLAMPAGQAAFPVGCRIAERLVPPGSVVLSSDFSGALRYYTALTPVRWDVLDPAGAAALRSKTAAAGEPWYALLADYEVSDAAARVPGRWKVEARIGTNALWRIDPPGAR